MRCYSVRESKKVEVQSRRCSQRTDHDLVYIVIWIMILSSRSDVDRDLIYIVI